MAKGLDVTIPSVDTMAEKIAQRSAAPEVKVPQQETSTPTADKEFEALASGTEPLLTQAQRQKLNTLDMTAVMRTAQGMGIPFKTKDYTNKLTEKQAQAIIDGVK